MALIKANYSDFTVDMGDETLAKEFAGQLTVTKEELVAALNTEGKVVAALFGKILKLRARAQAALIERVTLE